MVSFQSFSLPQPILRALAEMGFEEASPIQESAVPVILSGADVVGQAQTGTGKTAAFGIPLVAAAIEGRPGLVLVPTRELAQQVCAEIDRIGAVAGVRALALYGGAPFGAQARTIERGECQVIVATPGRLRDHIEKGTLDASLAKIVVLDEADEMLKMGFVDEVEEILRAVGPDRQTLLFSATMPAPVLRLAHTYMRDPEHVVATGQTDSVATDAVEQVVVAVEHREKVDTLVRFLAVERPEAALVFRHTREGVDELVSALRAKGFRAEALHGGMEQGRRDDVMARLRDGRARILVATDVAARGIDVESLTHVFLVDAPSSAEPYVHRIGRTGRGGREGRSFLFVTPAERGRLRGIERVVGRRLQWRDVPSDADVHAAVARATEEWSRSRVMEADDASRAIVDRLVADGADLRALAAGLLSLAARHEGLRAPPLEPRRERREAPRARQHEGRPYEARERPMRDAPDARGSGHIMAALGVSVGREDGVRPGDLVGAFANEGGLTGGDIGRIDILPRMSVLEVPESRVEELFETMRNASIRGRGVEMKVMRNWNFRAPARGGR